MTTSTDPASTSSKSAALPPEVYDDYSAFLRQVVREYYELGWRHHKGNFIAFVIASGQVAGIAGDAIKDGSGLKKAAIGAVSVVALRMAFKYFLSGPVGLVLSAAAVASAAAYLLKNQKEIAGKLGPHRTLIEQTQIRFEEIQGSYHAGKFDALARNLMVDGLRKQMLDQVARIAQS